MRHHGLFLIAAAATLLLGCDSKQAVTTAAASPAIAPSRTAAKRIHGEQDWNQRDVDQRSRRDTPKGCPRTLRRIDISHSAKRPEHDPIGLSPNLSASQGMSELMHQDDQEERNIFEDIPGDGRVASGAALNLVNRNQEPPPMQKHVDPEESKQVD